MWPMAHVYLYPHKKGRKEEGRRGGKKEGEKEKRREGRMWGLPAATRTSTMSQAS